MRLRAIVAVGWLIVANQGFAENGFRAGASRVDISPRALPAIRNGGFLQATSARVDDPLHVRCLALADEREQVAIAVVDSCMIPTDVCDAIKSKVSERTGLAMDRILISATHTHSAPSVMAYCLGSGRDEAYVEFVVPQIANAIVAAFERMQPAKIGWTSVDGGEFTNCRRWITRSDRIMTDPFGGQTVRAMMHPGYVNPDYVCPAGPVDPELSILSVVSSMDETPICVLANFSMHYFGSGDGFSADYFGDVSTMLESSIPDAAGLDSDGFVGIVSQGTSGDLHWMDYSRPSRDITRSDYSKGMAAKIAEAWRRVDHRRDSSLAMAEQRIRLRRRVPDAERMAWAKNINDARGDQIPRNQQEVYAQQAQWIHDNPETEVVLQAIRIGDVGIAALPNEVYGITGLKLKQQSPLEQTMNLELSNGAEGYIPPPEQHLLGGYTTWPARTAGLEVEAEPKIVEAVLSLLETVSGKQRRQPQAPACDYSVAVMKAKPAAYWRLDDMTVDHAADAADAAGQLPAQYHGRVALYLPGSDARGMSGGDESSRCVYFAGGSLQATLNERHELYSMALCFWNGLPTDSDGQLGTLFSRDAPAESVSLVERDGVVLLAVTTGSLQKVGTTPIETKVWHHVTLVHHTDGVSLYLNGKPEVEVKASGDSRDSGADRTPSDRSTAELRFGQFDGKLDEIAIFHQSLSSDQVRQLHLASGVNVPQAPERDLQDNTPSEADAAQVDNESVPQPTSPSDSLKRIHVRDGYEVQLVACEPEVKDPVAIDWGLDGTLWVVEMADYPLGMDGNGQPGGRVRRLQDQNGDGRYETSTLFAEGLPFPTGILVWGDGVLVTAAPEILYLEDSTGDGAADVRRVLYRGFLEGNQQLRVNGLRWGLDNWVYCASGSHHSGYGEGNEILSVITGQLHPIGSGDFRIQPDTGAIETLVGPSQYGRNRDDWGNWFGVQNSRPLWHFVLEDQHIRRNPHYSPPNPIQQVVTPLNPRVYPASKLEKRFHSFEESGRFTSACSAIIYRDELLFARSADQQQAQQHAFTCEPFHNLVQHNLIEPEGVSFGFRRDPEESEVDFFASEDRWCRPVMVRTGPDGALWVVDMYRYMIEHPEWLPENGKEELRPYYRLGDQHGRIYRVIPVQASPDSESARLSLGMRRASKGVTTLELLLALESRNGWQRDMAQRELIRRDDPSIIQRLTQMAASSEMPLARLHALCTLDGIGYLSAEVLSIALADSHSGVRRHAVRLARKWPCKIESLLTLVDDPDPNVRLELAATLGELQEPDVNAGLARIAARSADEPYIVANVMSSLNATNVSSVLSQFLAEIADQKPLNADHRNVTSQLLSQVTAQGELNEIDSAIMLVCDGELSSDRMWQYAAMGELLDGLARRQVEWDTLSGAGQLQIVKIIDSARTLVREVGESKTSGATEDLAEMIPGALPLLLRQPIQHDADLKLVSQLLVPQSSIENQLAAVNRLGDDPHSEAAEIMLRGWSGYGPTVRSQVLSTLASRTPWSRRLLDEVLTHRLSPAELDAAMRSRLISTPDEPLRQDWERVLATSNTSDRRQVIADYEKSLTMQGDVGRGAKVFSQRCASCHRIGNEGYEVGPNLLSITDKSPASLLAAVLDPSAAVESRYISYGVLTDDGRIHNGLLSTETASSMTLLNSESKSVTILRSEIEEIRASGKSLMPEGLEKEVTQQDMADLLQFLRGSLTSDQAKP